MLLGTKKFCVHPEQNLYDFENKKDYNRPATKNYILLIRTLSFFTHCGGSTVKMTVSENQQQQHMTRHRLVVAAAAAILVAGAAASLTLPVTDDAALLTSPATRRSQLGRKLTVGDDVIFTSHFLWAADVSAAAQCAVRCLGDEACQGFSFRGPLRVVGDGVGGGTDSNCRAHSTVCHAPLLCKVLKTTAPGFRFYGFVEKVAGECVFVCVS